MGEDRESRGVRPVLLFDGVCNFCNGAVRFIIERDPGGVFRFASLQSDSGRALLEGCGLEPGSMETMVLVAGDRCYTKSDAALELAARLGGAWRFLGVFRWIPRRWRDAAYRYFADHRYTWFGKSDRCLVPTPELRARFL
jgi:predicted DCC family thiol-disulfide oxidoreductase YuxK